MKQRNGKNAQDCAKRCKHFIDFPKSSCPHLSPVKGWPFDCGAYEPKEIKNEPISND